MGNQLEHRNWDCIDDNIIKEYNQIRSTENKDYICHSPFRSMFFRMKGAVNSCCYNTIYQLGNYPEQTPLEIWSGENAEKMRTYFKMNDMSLGCNWCKNNLINRNYKSVNALNYDTLPNHSDYPTQLEFELNNTCNLECIMCSSHCSSSISSKNNCNNYKSPYDSKFVTLLEPMIPSLYEVKFSGGEPFLIDLYFEIWEKIISINPKCRISVQTNGSVVNDRVKNILNKGNFIICISLDSVKKETYEKIRINNSFENFIKNISYFKSYYKEKGLEGPYFTTSIMAQNWEEAPSILDFLNENNFTTFFCSVVIPQHCSLWHMPSGKLADIISYFKSVALPERNAGSKLNKDRFTFFYTQLEIWLQNKKESEKGVLMLQDKDIHIVMQQLLDKIKRTISQYNHLDNAEKEALFGDCTNKINEFLPFIPGEDQKQTLLYLYELPMDYLIDGMKTEEKERIIESCIETIKYYKNQNRLIK